MIKIVESISNNEIFNKISRIKIGESLLLYFSIGNSSDAIAIDRLKKNYYKLSFNNDTINKEISGSLSNIIDTLEELLSNVEIYEIEVG